MATQATLVSQGVWPEVAKSLGDDNFVSAGSTLALRADQAGSVVRLDTATGSVVTLPASTGSGAEFLFVVSALATSNSHKVQVANGTDVMRGSARVSATGTGVTTTFSTVAASDTITFDRTNTGSVLVGEHIWVRDVAAGFWAVESFSAGATPATPFSAAV